YAGWLGRAYNPLSTVAIARRDNNDNPYFRPCSDDELNFQIDGLVPAAELALDRIGTRQSLLQQFETQREALFAGHRGADEHDRFQQRALALVTSERTRRALDIRQ